jgi:nicotinate-nucleotide adenylyltransferase
MNKKNLTAFFGGSFNPPHNGHLGVAQGALNSGLCGKVVWVPSWSQPHKQDKKAAPFHHRLAMMNLLIEGTKNMFASDLEERIKLQPSYTFEVLKHFAAELPENEEAALLIGADSLLALHTWYKAEELLENYTILTYPRPGENISLEALLCHWEKKQAQKLLSGVINGAFFEISSTGIRNSLVKNTKESNINNEDKNLLNNRVADYCRKYHLYTD